MDVRQKLAESLEGTSLYFEKKKKTRNGRSIPGPQSVVTFYIGLHFPSSYS